MSLPHASHVVTEVGRYYMVPCVYVENRYRTAWMPESGWVPVIGPKHEDAEHLKVPAIHFHIDWRFIGDVEFKIANQYTPALGRALSSSSNDHELSAPVMKRRKCMREMPIFPDMSTAAFVSSRTRWQSLERAQFATCNKLKPGNICPHRGIDLTPFRQADGTAVCPGHGLRWNLDTGELLVRHTADFQAPGAAPE